MTFLKRDSAVDVFALVTLSSDCQFELQVEWIRASRYGFREVSFIQRYAWSSAKKKGVGTHLKIAILKQLSPNSF